MKLDTFLFILFILPCVPSKIFKLDIAVIIDDSVSVFDADFMKEKEFVYRVYQNIDPSSTESRISVGKFSTEASVVIKFSEPAATDSAQARKVLDCSSQTKGGTCINRALEMANDEIFAQNDTSTSAKTLILITDGSCNCAGCTEMLGLATKIKQRNIQIITVGVGYGIDEEELKEIASDPSKYISAKEFDELLDVLTGIFASLEKLSDEQKNADELNFNANKDDKLILNDGEYIGSDSNKDGNSANSTKKGDDQKSGTDFPYMNPIIVNIQTCPHSKVQHVGCKPGDSRCFQIERNFFMTPTGLEEDLCRCSDLALKNNLNFFKIDEKGVCRIGTANAEECGSKRLKIGGKICSRKSSAIYKTSKI